MNFTIEIESSKKIAVEDDVFDEVFLKNNLVHVAGCAHEKTSEMRPETYIILALRRKS